MVAVMGLIKEKGMYFIQKRKAKYYNEFWEFPGGKVEKGETPVFALAREMVEELGIEIIDTDYVGCDFIYIKQINKYILFHYFYIRKYKGIISINKSIASESKYKTLRNIVTNFDIMTPGTVVAAKRLLT